MDVGRLCVDDFADRAPKAQLVVNCTSGPAADTVATLNPDRLATGASWVDINYWMDAPPGRAACEGAGVRFHNGLGMLAHQAALAFELFTGHPVTGAELRTFLEEQV